jgi:AcrR family transcriptional regulator
MGRPIIGKPGSRYRGLVTSTAPDTNASTGDDVRTRISAAAFELFAARGYEATTVDAIADQAGVARRTFFRYFKSKDDVIFPDHDGMLARAQHVLDTTHDLSGFEVIRNILHLVLRSYLDDPERSVERLTLTRSIPALRNREIATVYAYHRLFTRYLNQCATDDPDAPLHAEITAAAMVAAHNQVLRSWLQHRGTAASGTKALDDALDYVRRHLVDGALVDEGPSGARPGLTVSSPVMVAVFQSADSFDDVVAQVRRQLTPNPNLSS